MHEKRESPSYMALRLGGFLNHVRNYVSLYALAIILNDNARVTRGVLRIMARQLTG